MSLLVDEEVSTSDIDLLDDGKTHLICIVCTPIETIKPLMVIDALCGDQTIARTGKVLPEEECVDVCNPCAQIEVCPVCGSSKYPW